VHAGPVAGLSIRPAREEDGDALVEVDRATWSPLMTPGPKPAPGTQFWNERTRPENTLVAERDGTAVGYVKIEHPTELPASDHVWTITGLAVDPRAQGTGAGRALMAAVIDEARRRGGRRLTLRVFAPNERARRLYERLGFEVEGILRGEFHVGGDYVDDVLMALDLGR
jgi:ribosomal protein S18 acetylase RimI-like enzyme